MDEAGRIVCCVCDVGKMRNFPNNDYLCSKACEKVYFITQGLVLGNILQSMFRDVCEVRCLHDKTDTKPIVVDVLTESESKDSSHRIIPGEWPNVSSNMIDQKHRPTVHDSVSMHLCQRNTPQLQSDVGCVQPEEDKEDMNNVMCGDQSCEGDMIIPSDADSGASTDLSAYETVQAVVRKTSRLKTHIVVTARAERQAPKKKRPGRPRKNTCVENSEKCRTKRPSLRVKNNGFRLKDPVTSQNHAAVAEICKREPSSEAESEQDPNQVTNTTAGRRVKCKHCGKMISKSYLYVHYRAMHKDNLQDISTSSLSCSECGKLFLRKQALNAHKLKLHNHQFSIICSHCGKGFDSRFGLSWHMRQVHKVTVRQCGTCGETFENRRDYKKHRRNQHSASSHVCHVCGKGFTLKTALQAHLDAHAGVKLHFCEICGDGFVRFSSLYQHKNNVHGPKKSELPFKCHLCPNTFKLQSWLEKHIQKHQDSDQAKANCEMCREYFRTSIQCPVHGKGATETFPCPHCDKLFGKQTNLKAHMKRHQEPKFSCDVCQKKFTYKCNMLRHRETHNSEKPHHCDVCAKQFCSKFLLASHMRMHNQDLFKCEVCGKGLTRKDYLKNHMKKMHPEHA